MYYAELRETCPFFMSKEPKQKKVIEAVLDRHLSPNKLLLKTRYINSFEMIQKTERERIKCGKLKKQQHR